MGLKLEGEGITLEELKLEKVWGGREALDYPGLNLQWKRKN